MMPDRSPMHFLLKALLAAMMAFAMTACSGETTAPPAAEPDCTSGMIGCDCIEGTACFPGLGLACIDGTCQEPECDLGDEGCACYANNSCNQEPNGQPMLCDDGLCRVRGCIIGTSGCDCGEGGACEDALACTPLGERLICAALGCQAGEENCPCVENTLSCGVGLTCVQNTCIAPGCRPGALDCFCNPDLSCDDGLQCNGEDTRCEVVPCTPGSLGCDCNGNTCTDPNAICDNDGVCQQADCLAGLEGCACLGGDTCAVTESGQQLFCEGLVCRSPECVPGDAGCACIEGVDCVDGVTCVAGLCQPDDCTAGSEHCACAGGACHPGLRCREDNLCVDSTGAIGGACREDGTCDRGGRCAGNLCVACTLGSPGCGCDDIGACLSGVVCLADSCVAEADVPPQRPENPKCYSHCSSGLTIDGEFVPCGSDNLMEACLDGRTCREGACLFDDEPVPTCESEFDCPEHQTCGDGRCFSECDTNDECPESKSCYKHVCRVPCDSTDKLCPRSNACDLVDSQTGFCLPIYGATDTPATQITGSFSLSSTNLQLNNTRVTSGFVIENNSPSFQTFTIRKKSHLVQRADGSTERASRARDGLIECDPDTDEDCECDELSPNDPCFCTGDNCRCTDNDDCIADTHVCNSGLCRPAQCGAGECPMLWLSMGGAEDPVRGEEIEVALEAGDSQTVSISGAADVNGVRWQGSIDVISDGGLGTQRVNLLYTEVPEGQWAGQMVYLANFGIDDEEDQLALDAWSENLGSRSSELAEDVSNALIRRWSAFRRGVITWDEFQAVLTATRTGSWQYQNVVDDCIYDACYMYDIGQIGLAAFSTDLDAAPVPTGAVELSFAMNLRIPEPDDAPEIMAGRIESSGALQYAGNPAVSLRFAHDPSGCSSTAFGACLVWIEDFAAEAHIGGRYLTDPNDTNCALRQGDDFEHTRVQWLVPGFTKGTERDEETGQRYRFECRDNTLPIALEDAESDEAELLAAAINRSLAISNPIPDGRSRRRSLTLLDGVMVNQSQLFILFRETFASFLDGDSEGFSAYGFVVLERRATDMSDEDLNLNEIADVFEGSSAQDLREEPTDVLAPACSDEILDLVLGEGQALNDGNIVAAVSTLIDGFPSGSSPPVLDTNTIEQVHYLCEETGLFDGGPQNTTRHGLVNNTVPNNNSCGRGNNGECEDGGFNASSSICVIGTDVGDCGERTVDDTDVKIECPAGSTVTFFTVDSAVMPQDAIANQPCQLEGTCRETLNQWLNSSEPLVQDKPIFRCEADNEVYCDSNRRDLRDGKVFFVAGQEEAVFTNLQIVIDEAFRYKTRFQNRQGGGIGFAPGVCEPNSNAVPYCYDPIQIEEVQARIDCLLHVHQNFYGALNDTGSQERLATRQKLDAFLASTFSFDQEFSDFLPLPITHDGFERQLSQLLIMQGDDAFTRAFASRFDLAGANIAAFEGEFLEEGGINLSGAVGFEMFSLYQATQYYQMVLDRFFTHSPVMWAAIDEVRDDESDFPDSYNFVTPESVISYFDRVIRASTQKARAWGEVAGRYQDLNRPDLARQVAERAYTSAYLESVIMSRMMLQVVDASLPEDIDQIQQAVNAAQLRYQSALLDMQNVHSSIKDNITIFGFDPDFVPFPALDRQDFRQSNPFEVLLFRTRNKLQFAKEKEDLALASSREFETDQAQFQAELTSIKNNFEGRLSDLCGSFVASDDRVYPAIDKFAHLDERAALIGNPCGFMGNGQIHNAMAGFEDLKLEADGLLISFENVLEEVEIERERVSEQCGEIMGLADYVFERQGEINSLLAENRDTQFDINRLQQTQQVLSTTANLTKCSVGVSSDCPSALVALGTFALGTAGAEAAISLNENVIADRESDIDDLQQSLARWQTENECDLAKVESDARVKTMLLRLKELRLEAVRLDYRTRLGLSEIQRLFNEAKRLQLEQAETEQMAINVQAAHNNPNVRIYKNDSIINADIAFDDAIREAYKLTKVFEYYTSQSYERKNELFLIRMISRGDKNLENYVNELESTFFDFEEFFGNPATRVQLISLKDDVFSIPHYDDEGRALDGSERTELLRERLTDPALLDKNGYLTVSFSTDLDALSPLTRNHKILYIEADIYGNSLGDNSARVYVRQRGTSVIHGVNNDKQFHRFDTRTSVVEAIMGGVRFFDPTIYQSFRMRDRPFVNTHWELVINQRDEQVNQDINLNSLTDIRLYVYYYDHTVF